MARGTIFQPQPQILKAFLQIMELFHEELDTPIDSKFNFSKSEVSAICFCVECKQFTNAVLKENIKKSASNSQLCQSSIKMSSSECAYEQNFPNLHSFMLSGKQMQNLFLQLFGWQFNSTLLWHPEQFTPFGQSSPFFVAGHMEILLSIIKV